MSTLAPSRGSNTDLLEQPPTQNLALRTTPPREAARAKSPEHVKRKQNATMSTTTLSPPRETTTTVRVPETTRTSTTTSRVRLVLERIWHRVRPVPGSLLPEDHLDRVLYDFRTVHPMHLR